MSLDPIVAAFLKSLPPRNADSPPSVAEARENRIRLQGNMVAARPVDILDRTLSLGPAGPVEIRIVRPRGNRGLLPVLMYFHGGGWVVGDKHTYDRSIREIAHAAKAALVFVEYTRAPEARFPIANEEAYGATCWVAQQASELNVDPARLAVVGDSSGANMATVVALLAKQRGGPKIACQALLYPVTSARFDWPSFEQFQSGYMLTRDLMRWYWDQYAPNVAERTRLTAAVLEAPREALMGLPAALVITAENDVLRDEGEAYAARLLAAGVSVIAVRYLHTIHGFLMLNALANTPATRAAVAQIATFLNQSFATG